MPSMPGTPQAEKSRRVGPSARRPAVLLGICGFWAAVFLLLTGLPMLGWRLAPLERAQLGAQDFILRHGRRAPAPPEFVFLTLDESSLDGLTQFDPEEIAASPALSMMAEGFPWSRAVYGHLVERLLGAGAKVVVFDILLPSDGKGDEEFRAVLGRHPGRVVLASEYDESELGAGKEGGKYVAPSPSVLPSAPEDLVGFANFWPDGDGVVRSATYRLEGADPLGDRRADGAKVSLGALALKKAGFGQAPPAEALMRFCAVPSAGEDPFPQAPIWSVFDPKAWSSDLKNGEIFRGKIVVVGGLAERFRDKQRTPLGLRPGPELHLHAMAAAMTGSYVRRASVPEVMVACVAMASLAFLASWRIRRPLLVLAAVAAAMAGYFALALVASSYWGVLLGVLCPMATLACAGLTAFAYDFALERRARARTRRSLERYVSRDVVRELLDHENELFEQLGGARKDVAVMFTDLRGFTGLAEKADPARLVADLNEYLAAMVDIVFRNGGTVDKFIGDAVMAAWGTVVSAGAREDCTRAVQAAIDMLAAVAGLRRAWVSRGAPDLRLGIGMHYGPAIFGNIGSDLKMEPTVIGDTVNLASRLEGLTKRYGLPLLVSEAVAERADGAFPFMTVDAVRVAGRQAAVKIYTVPVDGEGRLFRPAWLQVHEDAWAHYRERRFGRADASFAEAVAGGADYPNIQRMRARCAELEAVPPGDDWDPVSVMESK